MLLSPCMDLLDDGSLDELVSLELVEVLVELDGFATTPFPSLYTTACPCVSFLFSFVGQESRILMKYALSSSNIVFVTELSMNSYQFLLSVGGMT